MVADGILFMERAARIELRGMTMNRRSFIAAGAAGAAGMMLAPGGRLFAQGEARAAAAKSARKPKNIIFMVSDGMSIGVPSLAAAFAELVGRPSPLWSEMLRDPEISQGFLETHSLNSMVTDSAAAGSSWGSGSRIFNGAINILPDGTRLTPINTVAKDAGKKVGLVTTTTITHATPSSFDVSVPSRNDQDGIAIEFLKSQADVYMGGGQKYLLKEMRKDGRDVLGEFAKMGYATATTKKELMSIPEDKRVFGVFYPSHLPYTIDHINSEKLQAEVPTLAEMTKKAIAHLNKGEKGFHLQVEGGRVDHAAHANDAAAIFWDQLAFDDAVRVAMEFAREDGETLVIVTTDHSNSSPSLNGMGHSYADSNKCFGRLALATGSYEKMQHEVSAANKAGTELNYDFAESLISQNVGIDLDKEELNTIVELINDIIPQEINRQHQNFSGIMGQLLANHNGIAWTGITHTAEYVLLSAYGPGQELFQGLINNYETFHITMGLWGIDFTNPSMTPDQAKKHLAAAPSIREVHWA